MADDEPTDDEPSADEVIERLGLEPLPDEGGMWRLTHADEWSTAIYYLVRPDDFSALHRLTGPEVYHHYAGAPVELVELHPDGRWTTTLLGDDLRAGQRPTHIVAAHVWQGSRTTGAWSLLGTTMAPPYTPEGFELGGRAELLASHPGAATLVRALTRA